MSASERHIAVLMRTGYRGEFSFAHRLKAAGQNINWDIDIFDINNCDLGNASYDFVINLVYGEYKKPKCKNYLAVFHPEHHFFDDNGHLTGFYRLYDGYLITYPFDMFKDPFPCMSWYPTVHKREFQIVSLKYLFHICPAWGNRLLDSKFKKLLSLLEKQPYVRLYGHPYFREVYPKGYKGEIPYDSDSLYRLASEAGVNLVIHSDEHNRCKLPSGRIFEAAASSTVIISDDNAFVREHFGDSVLYIDTTKSARSIFQQVSKHWNWIRGNREKALKKARASYSIYRNKFLLEDQLIRLGEFHDQLTNPI